MPRSTYDNEWPGELRQLEFGRPMRMPAPAAGEGGQWPAAWDASPGENQMESTAWPENPMQNQNGSAAARPEHAMQDQGGGSAAHPAHAMQNQGGSVVMRPGDQVQYQSDGSADGLRMKNQVDIDIMENPRSNADVYRGSMKALLNRNIGFYVVASFLVGTEGPVSWEGILYSVGNDYVVIYQPDVDRYISGDLYALKFVEFHNTRSMSPWAGYRRRDGQTIW